MKNLTPIKLKLNKAIRNLEDYLRIIYLDGGIVQSDQRYVSIWSDYNSARNELLKVDESFFHSIDDVHLPKPKLFKPSSFFGGGEAYMGYPEGSRKTIKAAIENALYYINEYENQTYVSPNDIDEIMDNTKLIKQVIKNWATMIASFKHNRADVKPIVVTNEYDLQYLFGGILSLFFKDIRPETNTPNYANKSNRTDFLLPTERILIETKMTRQGLDGRKLHEELIIDKEHYRRHQGVDNIICFVYDPDRRIKNPEGIKDIEELVTLPYFTIHFSH